MTEEQFNALMDVIRAGLAMVSRNHTAADIQRVETNMYEGNNEEVDYAIAVLGARELLVGGEAVASAPDAQGEG